MWCQSMSFPAHSKAFDSIHRGKMEQILLTYGLPKETVATIIMVYKNMKVKVFSPDGDSYFFNIVTDLMKENSFTLAKEKSRRYPTWMITNIDYADDSASGKYSHSGGIPGA